MTIKLKKVWIAEHPNETGNRDVSWSEPNPPGVYINSYYHDGEGAYCEYVEHALLPLEG